MEILILSLTLLAVTQCEHYANALFDLGDAAINRNVAAQKQILLHQMACEAATKQEFGQPWQLEHCVFKLESGKSECQFVME